MLGISSALVLSLAARGTRADPRQEDEPHGLGCSHSGSKQHLLGPILDTGELTDSAGLRYHHTHVGGYACEGLGTRHWGGYGLDVRGAFSAAVLGDATARVGMMGGHVAVPGIAIEAGIGGGTDFDVVRPSALLGIAFSVYWVDLGFSGQIPIGYERPHWLGSGQIALRVYLPLSTY